MENSKREKFGQQTRELVSLLIKEKKFTIYITSNASRWPKT